jgi:type VI protein secretion system component Hcp
MADEANGASRRDVLRGSAIGMGALVGAVALTNSNEVAAEAAGTSNHTYFVTISGINTSNSKIKVTSLGFGGEDDNGTPTPDRVSLNMPSGRFSPLMLEAFVQKSTHTVTIYGYQPNASGVTELALQITCTGAVIVHYHLGASSGAPTDNIQFVFSSIDLKWVLQNVHFTWTPVA